MGTSRRQFTDEFKREAVGLLVSSGRPSSQIARELGIAASMLRSWRDASDACGIAAAPAYAIPPVGADLAAENARLRRENERLRMEREILKKRCVSSRKRRGSAREVPGSRRVRRDGRLSDGVICMAWPARKPA
jgi:transposase